MGAKREWSDWRLMSRDREGLGGPPAFVGGIRWELPLEGNGVIQEFRRFSRVFLKEPLKVHDDRVRPAKIYLWFVLTACTGL